MTLDRMFVCCDDGEIYHTDVVKGDGWIVFFEEFGEDVLALPPARLQHLKYTGQASERARLALSIAQKIGLPILDLQREHVRCLPDARWPCFRIVWQPDAAFPRRLLPKVVGTWKPGQTGTYCCLTEQHKARLRGNRQGA